MEKRGLTSRVFCLLFERLAVDAEGGHRAGFEPWKRNFFLAAFADTIGVLLHPSQRFIDLFDQPLLALTDPYGKVLFGLCGSLIADVGEWLLAI